MSAEEEPRNWWWIVWEALPRVLRDVLAFASALGAPGQGPSSLKVFESHRGHRMEAGSLAPCRAVAASCPHGPAGPCQGAAWHRDVSLGTSESEDPMGFPPPPTMGHPFSSKMSSKQLSLGTPGRFFGLFLSHLHAPLLKQRLKQPGLIRYPVCVGCEA